MVLPLKLKLEISVDAVTAVSDCTYSAVNPEEKLMLTAKVAPATILSWIKSWISKLYWLPENNNMLMIGAGRQQDVAEGDSLRGG